MSAEVKEPLDNLDRIALEASGSEAEAQAVEDAILNPNPEPVIDPAQTWAQVPKMFGGLLAMAMPELAQVYTDDKCLAWGVGMAAVSEKYGWDAGETISRFGPEIALVVASLPLVLPTVTAIKTRRAEAAKKPPDKLIATEAEKEASNNPMLQEPGGFSVPS
jgi:hypothetical protein